MCRNSMEYQRRIALVGVAPTRAHTANSDKFPDVRLQYHFDFEETLREIHCELADLNTEAAELAAIIANNFKALV